jgi:NADH dehydrogenase
VLLLTGATGLLGHAVVRRLIARGTPVRCLVRDPRRLGSERVRVQLAIGDLADPASWRNALRGVQEVVHLAGGARDQPRATVEEINGLAAWRLLRAAERVGVKHFVWIAPLGATPHHPMRMHRAKALAARSVAESPLATTTLAHSLIYAPGDRHLRWIERLGYLPAVPLVGRGIARTQPIWAEDAADCVLAALDAPPERHVVHELAGPETLTQRDVVRLVLAAAGRRRRAVPLPLAGLRAALRAEEALAGPTALVTWDEAQLLAVEMLSASGTADAEALGVRPRAMAEVLGVGAPMGWPPRSARRVAAASPR